MAGYNVGIKRTAGKELEDLPLRDRRPVVGRIRALANDPRPRGCEKLSGEEKYRIRQGSLRILYEVDDHQSAVTVVKIGHRRDVYRLDSRERAILRIPPLVRGSPGDQG